MASSFIVNLADLNKILEQIKIAERNVAGENLVDIIGPDAVLLPMGLRTVDGSNNHLLPGETQAGAADEMFPRLLTPTYINEADGDVMPLGPPGGPMVTNTNYDPTITTSSNSPGVNVHSVADADPRIISNLIVDQTLTNRSALVAALVNIIGGGVVTVGGDVEAGIIADQILLARDAAAAAAPFAAATAAAYAQAVTDAGTVQAQLNLALASLAAVRADAAPDSDIDVPANGSDALTAAQAALDAANSALTALQAPNTTVAASDIAAAQAQVNALTAFRDAVNAVAGFTGGVNIPEFNAIVDAQGTAQELATAAQANLTTLTQAAAEPAGQHLANLLADAGIELSNDGSILIPNHSPDIGLSPANSAWMTFFGQFFDHGLDLVTKGGNGTIYIPLQDDDPLIAGPDHIRGNADDLAPQFRFMTLGRVTPFDANGNPSPVGTESQNTTTPFVDQNQTYTSAASHQVFLREYKFSADTTVDTNGDGVIDSHDGTHALNTGRLLDGVNGGIANWGEVKAQATEKLGLTLDDSDVLNVPQLVVDDYGKFTPGAHGYAQIMVNVFENDGTTTRVSTVAVEGKAGGLDIHNISPTDLPAGFVPMPGATATVFQVIGTGHAFLNDIAHTAAPVIIGGVLQPDADTVVGNAVPNDGQGHNLQYDNELLDLHFATGDGRGNENIGLSAVHTIFHSEHNRLVEVNKDTIIASGDVNIVNEWLAAGPDNVRAAITQTDLDNINAMDDPAAKAIAIDALNWDGERLFQAARFVTEMQYQHLVFEEFARRVQPNVDPFVFTNSADLNPAILAEFAHTVYRFGHSMLVDTVDRLDNDLSLVNSDNVAADDAQQVGLIEAFLNPLEFTAGGVVRDASGNFVEFNDEVATGALIRGMSRSVGNEIDEFVVEALRNNLLGLPLDLPVLNMARGRETGIPSLNEARDQIYTMSGAADLKPYTSWVDFTQHIKHPLSVINFIAAYGTHALITAETTLEGKRAAAMAIVLGTDQEVPANSFMHPPVLAHTVHAPADRHDFLNATGAYAADGAGPHDDSLGGLNHIDLWVGGLAEEINEFGGQLGSTFNYVFEYQLEHLQNGDRFYYLSRTQGMNLLNLLEPNTFTDLVMRNTDLGDLHSTHLPANLMSVTDFTFELDKLAGQENYSGNPLLDGTNPSDRSLLDPVHEDPFQQAIDPKLFRVEGTARMNGATPVLDADGQQIFDGGVLRFSGGEHVTLGGTEGNDSLYGDKGIDTLWGDGGDDYLNAGMESDNVFGGDGDDIIEDPFGDNFLRGEGGDDVISSDTGLSILFGGEGKDVIIGVTDNKEVFAGPGDDFILGGMAPDALMGNEGNDWIEGGEGFDGLSGENSDLFFNSPIIGHDILNGQGNDTDYDGESGDDIMVQGPGIQRNNGMLGFDWSIQKGDENDGLIDLGISRFANQLALTLRDRNDAVEGASGWMHNDTLIGTSFPVGAVGRATGVVNGPATDSQLLSQNVDLIRGLEDFIKLAPGLVIGQSAETVAAMAVAGSHFRDLAPDTTVFNPGSGGDILLGGAGSDIITGNAGNDLIDGDRWLNVRISIHASKDMSSPELFTVDSLTSVVSGTGNADWDGKRLTDLLLTREINPGQLEAVREIISDGALATDTDVAVFHGPRADFTLTRNANGTVTVVDNVVAPLLGPDGVKIPLLDDEGIDTLANMEIARFANYDANGVPTGSFTDVSIARASGAPTITSTGTSVLTASTAGIVDDNGIVAGTVRFQWQTSTTGTGGWSNIGPLTTNANRTITDTNFYRVVVSYTDGDGLAESVTSQIVARVGTAAADLAFNGTADPNVINGLAGNDTLNGLGGNDVLHGGAGADALNGGADNDTLIAGTDNVRDVLDGGTGNDTADYSAATAALTVTLNGAAAVVVGGSGTTVALSDTIANIENFTGGSGADNITGDTLDNVLKGGAGVDTLNGGDGNDTLDGGANPAATGDVMTGGAGNDTYVIDDVTGVGAARDQVIEAAGAAGGIDTVTGAVSLSLANYANVENITLTGNTNVNATGNASDNVLTGNAGNNTLTGNNGNDTFTGGAGNDAVIGGTGTDTAVFTGTVLDHTITTTNAGVQTVSGGADGTDTLTAIEKVQFGSTAYTTLLGTAAAETVSGTATNDLIFGLEGDDTVDAGAGDDTVVWRAGDGRDVASGGANGTVGDAFSITGDASDETYTVYSRFEWLNVAGNLSSDLNANTDIVITRNGSDTGSVVAELDQFEEISINTGAGNDSVLVVGNLTPSDLRFSTITVNAGTGDDTVDISRLTSAHHVVLNTDGGNDHMIGMRAQDEINVTGPTGTGGATGGNGGGGNDNGGGGGAGDDNGNNGGGGAGDDTGNNGGGGAGDDTGNGGGGAGDDTGNGGGGVGDDTGNGGGGAGDDTGNGGGGGGGCHDTGNGGNGAGGGSGSGGDGTGTGTGTPQPVDGLVLAGTPLMDVLIGAAGDDTLVGFASDDVIIGNAGADAISAGDGADVVNGGDGRDVIFAGAGDDQALGGNQADVIYGEAGADRLFGDQGNDMITAGAGDDSVFGGAGDDLIVAEINDGNDVYFGDDSDGGSGIDTLDMSAATVDTFVNLGNGSFPKGSASSAQTGNDTLWGIENVNTGSGNDTIVASNAVNVMNGGAGDDTYKFTTTAAADGDTILGFAPGDRVDLSAIDANTGTAANDAFTLITGAEFTAAGQLAVSFESRADGDFTVIQGNIDGNLTADFRIEVEGHHAISNANLTL